MKITKTKSEIGTYDIRIEENEDKHLDVIFGGNGDIYWVYDNFEAAYAEEDSMYEAFTIPIEEEGLYNIFNELYEDLINCRIMVPEPNEFYPGQRKADEERCNKSNEELKNDYRYKSLVKDGIITWYSDEEYHEIAEIVRISKVETGILLEFLRQSLKDDMGFRRMPGWYSIRFRTSGSTYTPCDLVFWRHFDNLQKYQDQPSKKGKKELELKKENKI